MGLFDSIIGSISNQGGGGGDLGGILQGLQSLGAQQGAGGVDMQAVIAALGKHIKSGLTDIERSPTPETAAQVADKVASQSQASPEAMSMLFGSQSPQAVAEDVGQKTGLAADKVMALLPMLLPIVMKLLQSGGQSQGSASGISAGGGVGGMLKGFLDSDNDGDVDLQDVMRLAAKFK